MSKVDINIQDDAGIMRIQFAGIIDEDVDFSSIPTEPRKEYHFDFDGVTGINSCGIREWVRFTERLDPTAHLVYEKCTQIIIEQINMVAGFFRSGSTVKSFYAPYFCEKCDSEKKMLIDAGQVNGVQAPELNCGQSPCEMEFDALEEQYFRFLKMSGN